LTDSLALLQLWVSLFESHFRIIPRRHNIGPRPQHEMKVVRQNRKHEQVDAHVTREQLQPIFDPLFPVVKVLPRDRIIAEQKGTDAQRDS